MTLISKRALRCVELDDTLLLLSTASSNPWSDSNPKGIISMGLAENKLMHTEIVEYLNANLSITPEMLTYGDGPSGTFELRSAIAGYINNHFNPREKLASEHVTIMNGVTSVLDALCFCIAEPDDGILITKPLYGRFVEDLQDRAGVKPVLVSVRSDDPLGMAAVGHHETAIIEARDCGVNVKVLLMCNPHNPLGRCYKAEVIEAYLSLCSKYDLHLICDEVYGRSIFPSKDIVDPLEFTSVLAIDIGKFIEPSLVHVIYGMGKDFCANGLRIGAFISLNNPKLHTAMSGAAMFSWASSLSMHAWTLILVDDKFQKLYQEKFIGRMTSAYEMCTNILKEIDIPYVAGNAGPFIWLDMGAFMEKRTIAEEIRMVWKLINCGVWLAAGEAFRSEVPGWFRITFAMPEEPLRLGMERLRKALGA